MSDFRRMWDPESYGIHLKKRTLTEVVDGLSVDKRWYDLRSIPVGAPKLLSNSSGFGPWEPIWPNEI